MTETLRNPIGSLDLPIALGFIILLALYFANLREYATFSPIPETGNQIFPKDDEGGADENIIEKRDNPLTISPTGYARRLRRLRSQAR